MPEAPHGDGLELPHGAYISVHTIPVKSLIYLVVFIGFMVPAAGSAYRMQPSQQPLSPNGELMVPSKQRS